MTHRPPRSPVVQTLVAVGSAGLGWLAFLDRPPSEIPPIRWPAGVAVAAFVVFGRSVWPGVLAGACLARVWSVAAPLTTVPMGAVDTIGAILGAELVRRFAAGTGVFETPKSIVRFFLIAGCVAGICAVGSAATATYASGPLTAGFGPFTRAWFLSHLTGIIVVTPVVLLWVRATPKRASNPFNVEAIALLVMTIGVGTVAFAWGVPVALGGIPLAFLTMPILLWAALRQDSRELATAMAAIAVAAVWGTEGGIGPLVRGSHDESIMVVQAYVCVAALVAMVLGAAVGLLKQAEAKLTDLAMADPLTGLANYRRLLDVLRAEVARSSRTHRPFAVLMVDLTGLKAINDEYGHLVGSHALCRLAEMIRGACRTVDTAARLGGDEFAVVLPETGAEGGRIVLQRLIGRLAADSATPPVRVRGGVAVFPEDGDNPTMILRGADEALARARTGEPVARSGALTH